MKYLNFLIILIVLAVSTIFLSSSYVNSTNHDSITPRLHTRLLDVTWTLEENISNPDFTLIIDGVVQIWNPGQSITEGLGNFDLRMGEIIDENITAIGTCTLIGYIGVPAGLSNQSQCQLEVTIHNSTFLDAEKIINLTISKSNNAESASYGAKLEINQGEIQVIYDSVPNDWGTNNNLPIGLGNVELLVVILLPLIIISIAGKKLRKT